MDPILLPAIVHTLAPVLGVLVVFGCPVALIWLLKNHQFRMKELELEQQRLASPSLQQLAAIEARLAAVEEALKPAAPRNALQDRAALLEGPATSAADAARLRQR